MSSADAQRRWPPRSQVAWGSWARSRRRGSPSGCSCSHSSCPSTSRGTSSRATRRRSSGRATSSGRSFLYVAREANWIRLRWIVWGNLAFTGTLLLATFWHIDEFNWSQFTPPTAHIWVILYIFEPVVMIYLIPRGILRAEAPVQRRPHPPVVQAIPRPRDRAAAHARPAPSDQPGVRGPAVGLGSSTRSTRASSLPGSSAGRSGAGRWPSLAIGTRSVRLLGCSSSTASRCWRRWSSSAMGSPA